MSENGDLLSGEYKARECIHFVEKEFRGIIGECRNDT